MLKTMIEKFELAPWQDFRDDFLWTTEVDKVMKANAEGL